MRFDFCGRSALLVAQADAGIGGFVNACRHRGSRLVDGDATTGLAYCIDGRIRCPAHGWIYESTGALAHVPRESIYPSLVRGALALEASRRQPGRRLVFVALASGPQLPLAAGGEWLARCEPARLLPLRRLAEPRVLSVACNWRVVCADWPRPPAARQPGGGRPPSNRVVRAVGHGGRRVDHGAAAQCRDGLVGGWLLRQLATLPPGRLRAGSALFVWPNAGSR
jgi:nitrite reductase/ring-hydroxylating ferredoxin subunit